MKKIKTEAEGADSRTGAMSEPYLKIFSEIWRVRFFITVFLA